SKRWVSEMDFEAVTKGWILKRKVFNHKPKGIQGIAFNIRKPPFDDVRVREAFAHMLNREEMLPKLFYNEYDYVDSFEPGGIYENPTNPKVRYSPEKAEELLDAAGWKQVNRNTDGWLVKDGVVFELTLFYASKAFERVLTLLQENLKEIGIKLEGKPV